MTQKPKPPRTQSRLAADEALCERYRTRGAIKLVVYLLALLWVGPAAVAIFNSIAFA